MTEAWTYIDGEKVMVPLTPVDAEDYGWHKGVEYRTALRWDDNDYGKIGEWCRETFDPHTYKMFMRSVWFLREEDALLCQLRWK